MYNLSMKILLLKEVYNYFLKEHILCDYNIINIV